MMQPVIWCFEARNSSLGCDFCYLCMWDGSVNQDFISLLLLEPFRPNHHWHQFSCSSFFYAACIPRFILASFILSSLRTVFLNEDGTSQKHFAISIRIIFGFASTSIISNLDRNKEFLSLRAHRLNHFMTLCGKKCNENIGHIVASG